jgi:hypothetical protein
LTETYDVGIILGHFYTGYGITSRQKKRMQKGLELLKIARIASVMTTGGKGLWKKSAPSMGEVWSIFDFFWNIAGNLKRFLHKVNILTISK